MILQFLSQNRSTFWTLLALAVLLALHEWSGVSKWLLLVPVLLARIAVVAFWERLFSRQ